MESNSRQVGPLDEPVEPVVQVPHINRCPSGRREHQPMFLPLVASGQSLLQLLRPIPTQCLNRETGENVRRAGLRMVREEHHWSDVVKIIEARAEMNAE